ncbi:synaptojanin-PB [Capsaspora owczarzaki ATCC 30864]|uniref:phosphoinositide 5-phosphatase n=1 Tax=Capsaspora owczarzaki (strain ATCC 30864) TaxID=595528 RepID=A0A0D2UH34_CAPO3|nr:synaptojanin-PB [Capsaspora owczarzaki ATCC 30864]KJE94431.1 synaptojanin-PB [Capsaspora owczarzaki ATCC 30864]|eukprot:XP_004346759.2 synaptojanin-PB [Capsaspora owczarzaki ATCC 30864]
MGLITLCNDIFLVLITECMSVGKVLDAEIFRIRNVEFVPVARAQSKNPSGQYVNPTVAELAVISELLQEQIVETRKLVTGGSFYFAFGYELSLSAQRQSAGDMPDDRFVWNRHLQQPFEQNGIETYPWCLSVTRGFVEFRTVYAGAEQIRVAVISRLSCERAGKRFLTRGVDDDGNVANFAETEQLLIRGDKILSHIQIRGSVPVFWEQPGVQVGSHKVRLSRGFEATAPAFSRHIERQLDIYQRMWLVNLLGSKEGEKLLTDTYESHVRALESHDGSTSRCPLISFDFHAICYDGNVARLGPLLETIRSGIEGYGFFEASFAQRGPGIVFNNVVSTQSGVVRTNCLDCLDRTNVLQATIAMRVLQLQLSRVALDSLWSRFDDAGRGLWIKNGDAISHCYAGTGALKSDIAKTGKRTAMGKMRDLQKSVSRAVQNNFLDGSQQDAIDLFLGNRTDRLLADAGHGTDPTQRKLVEMMRGREHEFTTYQRGRVFLGTWNVNGGKRAGEEALHSWLIVPPGEMPPDVYAVGFQEIVDLTAGNIMNADDSHRTAWEKAIKDTINSSVFPNGQPASYALVVSQQLVGVCLCIFVRSDSISHVRDVVIGKHKTGFGGYAGNKGAVAIRFRMYSTSICFVCAHLAAGQSNVTERNSDYADIMSRMSFGKGRVINNHDIVFWIGDFNYRIDLPKEEVEGCVKNGDLATLYEADQLRIQRENGAVFAGFVEAPIIFVPTYKYDLYSDVFDTSEKARAPAWCDRVLWRGENVDVLTYNRAELKSSDHRPVYATFDLTLKQFNEQAKKRLRTELLKTIGVTDVILAVWPIDPSLGEEDVAALFAPYGNIIAAQVTDSVAYVSFSDPDAAQRALAVDRQTIAGREVRVAFKSSHVASKHRPAKSDAVVGSSSSRNSLTSTMSRESALLAFDDDMDDASHDYLQITDLNKEADSPQPGDEPGLATQGAHSDLASFSQSSAQARPSSGSARPTPVVPARPASQASGAAPPARPAPPKRPPAPTAASSTSAAPAAAHAAAAAAAAAPPKRPQPAMPPRPQSVASTAAAPQSYQAPAPAAAASLIDWDSEVVAPHVPAAEPAVPALSNSFAAMQLPQSQAQPQGWASLGLDNFAPNANQS